jgi:PAS domain S-box-containing protein
MGGMSDRCCSRAEDEERFRNLAEHANDLIGETDAAGRYLYASPNHRDVLGWDPAALVGSSALDRIHPDDLPATRETFRAGIESGRPDQVTCRLEHADGSWRWFAVSGRSYRNRAGELRVALVGRDVSAQRAAEEALRESERRHRLLVETASCGIVEAGPDARIVFANPALAAMMGTTPEALLGRGLWEFQEDPAEGERIEAIIPRLRDEQPPPQRRILHLRGLHGRRVIVEIDWNYRRGAAGELLGFMGVVIDVTRREQADAALAHSHVFISRIADTTPALLSVSDVREQTVVWANSRVASVLGWDAAALRAMGRHALERTVHPEDRPRVYAALTRLMRLPPDAVVEAEYRGLHVNGDWRWLRARWAVFTRDPDGSPRELLAAQEDITDQRRAAEELRAQEERFRLLAENAGDVILEFDERGDVSYVSPSWTQLTGHPVDVLLAGGLSWLRASLVAAEDAAGSWPAEASLPVFQQGTTPNRIYRIRHADGSWRWFETRSSLFRTAEGERRGLTIARDVTDRVRAEEALRTSESRLRVVAENAFDFIAEVDADGELAYMSPSFRDILGLDPTTYKTGDAFTFVHPDDIDAVVGVMQGLLAGRPQHPITYRHRHANGRWRWLETTGISRAVPDGRFAAVTITRDVSERVEAAAQARDLQERLLQAQKLESLGVLAGGIAHDFNNLLVGMLGNASLALAELPADSPLREPLAGIETAALRAAELTNQMLAYSGKGRFVVAPLDLSELVREMAHLLEASISKKAVLRHDLAAGLPPVDGDAAQLRQLVMNLITNASDALGDAPGTITLHTRLVEEPAIGDTGALAEEVLAEGPCVLLEVSDTGCGMTPDTLGRIFEPFFTTKFTGRGLGLAAALGIVRGHRGAVDVQSDPGRGTRFRVLLRAAHVRPACAADACEAAPAPPPSGAVLVADDEEVVRTLSRRILERAGFRVLCAADGRQAVETFRRHAGEISAVLLDLTMPHLGGEEALRAIREVRADVPVVVTSGYSESEIALRFERERLEGFLQKPFRAAQLLERMRAALARA